MRIEIQLRITAADDSMISTDLPYFDMLPRGYSSIDPTERNEHWRSSFAAGAPDVKRADPYVRVPEVSVVLVVSEVSAVLGVAALTVVVVVPLVPAPIDPDVQEPTPVAACWRTRRLF
jgi:hypothetical protein